MHNTKETFVRASPVFVYPHRFFQTEGGILKHKISILLFALLTFVASVFSGCASNGGSNTYTIPQNGIVLKTNLEQVQKNGSLAIFKGSSSGIDYEWTFIGKDIKNPTNVNLKVSFQPSSESAMQRQADGQKVFAFSPTQKGILPGKPTLSITVGKKWAYGVYNLYTENSAGTVASAGSVQVVDGIASLQFEKNDGGWYFFTKDKIASAVPVSSSETVSSTSSVPESSTSSPNASATTGSSSSFQNTSSVNGSTVIGGSKGNSTSSSGARKSGDSATVTGNSSENSSTPAPVVNPSAPSPAQKISVTITIRCDTAVANWNDLKPGKQDHSVVPANGCILPVTTETVGEGETVYGLLVKVCEGKGIQMEHKGYAIYNSEYIEGINNLYEFDGGQLSGWMYEVNGWYPNYGVSQYVLKNGDAVAFNYTCNLGRDLPGAGSATG